MNFSDPPATFHNYLDDFLQAVGFVRAFSARFAVALAHSYRRNPQTTAQYVRFDSRTGSVIKDNS
jgi:hypothetical protein